MGYNEVEIRPSGALNGILRNLNFIFWVGDFVHGWFKLVLSGEKDQMWAYRSICGPHIPWLPLCLNLYLSHSS